MCLYRPLTWLFCKCCLFVGFPVCLIYLNFCHIFYVFIWSSLNQCVNNSNGKYCQYEFVTILGKSTNLLGVKILPITQLQLQCLVYDEIWSIDYAIGFFDLGQPSNWMDFLVLGFNLQRLSMMFYFYKIAIHHSQISTHIEESELRTCHHCILLMHDCLFWANSSKVIVTITVSGQ